MCKYCPTPDLTPFLPLVHKGVAFLDENGPNDWRDSIAMKKLNVGDGDTCVLAHIYGNYHRGVERLGICETFAATAGFVTPEPDDIEGLDYDEDAWDRALTAAWQQVLAEEKAPVAA